MDPLEDVLRRDGRKVGDQLAIDRQVGGKHEEVLDLFGSIQISDERTHETSLADAGGQRKAEGRKISLEVLYCWKRGLDRSELLSQVSILVEVNELANSGKDL